MNDLYCKLKLKYMGKDNLKNESNNANTLLYAVTSDEITSLDSRIKYLMIYHLNKCQNLLIF